MAGKKKKKGYSAVDEPLDAGLVDAWERDLEVGYEPVDGIETPDAEIPQTVKEPESWGAVAKTPQFKEMARAVDAGLMSREEFHRYQRKIRENLNLAGLEGVRPGSLKELPSNRKQWGIPGVFTIDVNPRGDVSDTVAEAYGKPRSASGAPAVTDADYGAGRRKLEEIDYMRPRKLENKITYGDSVREGETVTENIRGPGKDSTSGGSGGGGGYGGYGAATQWQSQFAPGGYYPPGFDKMLDELFMDGDLTTDEYSKELTAWKQWNDSPEGAFARSKRAFSEASDSAHEANRQFAIDTSTGQIEAGKIKLDTADKLLESDATFKAEVNNIQNDMDRTRNDIGKERERIKRVMTGTPNVIGGIMRGIVNSVAVGLGAYAATMAGTKNFAQDAVNAQNASIERRLDQELMRSQKIQNALGQEMNALRAKLGSTQAAHAVLKQGMLQAAKEQIGSKMLTAIGEGGRKRAKMMRKSLDSLIKGKEADIESYLKDMERTRLAMARRAQMAAAYGAAQRGKEQIEDGVFIEDKYGIQISFEGPNGIETGILNKELAKTYLNKKEALEKGLAAAGRLVKNLESNTTRLGPLEFDSSLGANADVIADDVQKITHGIARDNNPVGVLSDPDVERAEGQVGISDRAFLRYDDLPRARQLQADMQRRLDKLNADALQHAEKGHRAVKVETDKKGRRTGKVGYMWQGQHPEVNRGAKRGSRILPGPREENRTR